MIRQSPCHSPFIYAFIQMPVTSFYTHSFNSRLFFRFSKNQRKINSSLFLCPQWPNKKWTFTSLWNVKITVDDDEIKLFESNQKPDHKSPPHMPPHSQAPMDHPGEGENWEEEMKLQQQEREALFCSWHTCETFWRLWNGSRPGPDPSRKRASGVARVKTCIWMMEKAERLLDQKHVPAWNSNLFRQQWIRKVSSGQTQFIDIGFHVSLWKRPCLGDPTQSKHRAQAKTSSGITGGICSTWDTNG